MPSTGSSGLSPPEPQELEISLFGPGFGECVVLHLGNGDWGLVDSCLDPGSKRPAALKYLESLHVDVERAVRFVLASHWHDDHIQGICSVFQAAKSAVFASTGAVGTRHFGEILASWTGTRFLSGGSGIDELHGVMSELNGRTNGTHFATPRLASVNKVLWERKVHPVASVKALSPSDAAVIATMAHFRDLAPGISKPRRRIPNIKPNNTSVVVAVQVGEHWSLLGADLERCGDPALGWIAIVEGVSVGDPKHQVFKVPHHGSPTAHDDEVWSQMLVGQPSVATTPFVSGNVKLPSLADCQRILARTPKAFLTAPPKPRKFTDPSRTVEKTVAEATLSAHFVPGRYGHVRMRKRIEAREDADWDVAMFGDAVYMANYVLAEQ